MVALFCVVLGLNRRRELVDVVSYYWHFFFQAEYGIRGYKVTGVQTCALPIYLAGIVNTAGHFYTSTNAELSEVYSQIGVTTEFKDIVSGNCGAYAGYLAKIFVRVWG